MGDQPWPWPREENLGERAREMFDGIVKRVEALETRADEAAYATRFDERERRHRWWETYNAALTGLLQGLEAGGVLWERAGGIAKQYADEAHGPLEAKKEA